MNKKLASIMTPFSIPEPLSLLGDTVKNSSDNIRKGLAEMKDPAKFFGVAAGWTALDVVGHQLFPATAGEKTPPGYYGRKMLWAVPALAIGRIVSDTVGGNRVARAFALGTVANSLIQLRYLFTASKEFNLLVFLMHEAILVPMSMLIVGDGTEKIY